MIYPNLIHVMVDCLLCLFDEVIMDLMIFDCDGTLVDSEFLCNLAMERQLATQGIEYKAEDLIRQFRGVNLNLIIESIELERKVQMPSDFEIEYRKKVSELFEQQLKANQGVVELLESLTIPYCVASSGPKHKIKQALKVTGLEKYFGDNIFSSYDINSWKPDPGVFLFAAEAMKVKAERCCVIEDSIVGLKATNAANMTSVYYAPEVTEKQELASIQVQHMSELIGKFD